MTITYLSPAKINLSLDIVGVRSDGYHELQSVVHCVGLYDRLIFDFESACDVEFTCSDKSLEANDNLVCHAARAWLDDTDELARESFSGVRIELQKNIPCGAGLGGGSGNAATTLRALNDCVQSAATEEQLNSIAGRLGADVPLFLHGGCVLMEGIGEKLTPLPALNGAVVLIVPNQHASTPAVYQCFDKLGKTRARSTPAMIEAVDSNNLAAAAFNLQNDLREAAEQLGIDVDLPVALLKKHGALGAQMSGSGAASFGLFPDLPHAERAMQSIVNDPDLPASYKVFCAPLIADGIRRLDGDAS